MRRSDFLMRFYIEMQKTPSENFLYLYGSLDLYTARTLRTALQSVVQSKDKCLVMNLQNLKFIDSEGIKIILSVLKKWEEIGAPVKVCEIPSSLKRFFQITGIPFQIR
jgi:anti-sigma B factor antagonist